MKHNLYYSYLYIYVHSVVIKTVNKNEYHKIYVRRRVLNITVGTLPPGKLLSYLTYEYVYSYILSDMSLLMY